MVCFISLLPAVLERKGENIRAKESRQKHSKKKDISFNEACNHTFHLFERLWWTCIAQRLQDRINPCVPVPFNSSNHFVGSCS
jgi:hypothetical protein